MESAGEKLKEDNLIRAVPETMPAIGVYVNIPGVEAVASSCVPLKGVRGDRRSAGQLITGTARELTICAVSLIAL